MINSKYSSLLKTVGIWRLNDLGEYELTEARIGSGPTGDMRWTSRNPENHCTDKDAQELAESLVTLKHKIRDMAQEEKRLKKALASRMKPNQWTAVTYKDRLHIVEHARTPQTRILNTKKALGLITKWVGDEKAAELYTSASRSPQKKSGIYVRLNVEV